MALNIITGTTGKNHVTSQDARDLHMGICGNGEYVLNIGQKLAHEVLTNTSIRIKDGDILMQGCHARLVDDDYEDLSIQAGESGYKRYDLICAKYEKDTNTEVESMTFEVVTGTQTTGTPTNPTYTSTILREGGNVNYMPLYRVYIDGINISSVTQLFTITKSLTELNTGITPIDFSADITYNIARTSTNVKALFYPMLKLVVINFNIVPTNVITGGVETGVFTVPTAYKPSNICYVPLASTAAAVETQGLISAGNPTFSVYSAGNTQLVRGMLVYDTV
ncbi:hypothetical protein [Anaerosacchariphilus polymeriproducens]|uniref:Uncharacterized protein n=1 Tax=Anaerosacchariphilus polymeriproducens TaxID=1812858 RepID=A0A371AT52_9FIRM|nr:hypothetical protein [Anaerosacchariphilus polymeriproducens]RDU22753.1 hypothetical protein DWV06_13370 [Anaerosacchariphilus polymeriproducens]